MLASKKGIQFKSLQPLLEIELYLFIYDKMSILVIYFYSRMFFLN